MARRAHRCPHLRRTLCNRRNRFRRVTTILPELAGQLGDDIGTVCCTAGMHTIHTAIVDDVEVAACDELEYTDDVYSDTR